MKKLFQSDSNVRVRPVQSFVELEARLREVFATAKEEFQLAYLFANWDFATWFQEHSFEPSRDFKGYSFDLVFKYTYVGEALWQHGGVQVLYKDRLSYTGTASEAEWKPIQRATRSRPSHQGTESVEVNETVSNGVLFVQRPPDLRTEPPREEFAKGDDTFETTQACQRIVNGRSDSLSEESIAFWKALKAVHEEGRHASAVPSMPFTSGGFQFDGSPRPLLPLLKDLALRFPRPLITWDLFGDAPPPEFPAPRAAGEDAERPAALGAAPEPQGELRDPRRVNHITHSGYSAAAASRDAADLKLHEWLEAFPGRVEGVQGGKLYMVRLDEQDGEFKLGLVQSEGKIFSKPDEEGKPADFMRALWFRRCGVEPKKCNDAKNFSWPKNPAFELYMSSSGRIEDELEVKSFLLEVEDADLTEAGLAQKLKAPKLTETFVKKLQMLADKYDLRGGASKGSAPAAGAKSSVAKGAAAKGAGAKGGGAKRGESSCEKVPAAETENEKRAASLPHASAPASAANSKAPKRSRKS